MVSVTLLSQPVLDGVASVYFLLFAGCARRCFELLERLALDGLGEMPHVSSINAPIDAKRYLKRYMLRAFDDASAINQPGDSAEEEHGGLVLHPDDDEEDEDGSGDDDWGPSQARRDLSDSDDGESTGSADA